MNSANYFVPACLFDHDTSVSRDYSFRFLFLIAEKTTEK